MLFYVFFALVLLAATEGYQGCINRADNNLCDVIKKAGWCMSPDADLVSAASLYCHETCGFCDWSN